MKRHEKQPRKGDVIVPVAATAPELLPVYQRNSLASWFGLYLAVEESRDSNTFQAK